MKKDIKSNSHIPLADVSEKATSIYLRAISNIINKGDFILGNEVSKFENNFSSFIGSKYCVGVASGTDAILLALRAIGVKKGDEVIVPAFSFIASATPIIMLDAIPIFVDVRVDLPLIDENKVEQAITKKTKAIIVVHLYGFVCEMDKIMSIANKYNLKVVEDCAQAHGSMYKGKKVGSIGEIGTFSFYPTKNIGAFGDAGAITTTRTELYEKFKLLRDHGQISKYNFSTLGYNSRLDSIQAAILNIKLKQFVKYAAEKKIIAQKYSNILRDLPCTVLFESSVKNETVLHQFVILEKNRSQLQDFLKVRDVATAVHYPQMLPQETMFKKYSKNKFPHAFRFSKNVISLPFYPGLKRVALSKIIESIRDFYKQTYK